MTFILLIQQVDDFLKYALGFFALKVSQSFMAVIGVVYPHTVADGTLSITRNEVDRADICEGASLGIITIIISVREKFHWFHFLSFLYPYCITGFRICQEEILRFL
jgi:hypothetical protein